MRRKSHKIKYINGVAHIKLCGGFERNRRGRMVCRNYVWIERSRVTIRGQYRRRR